MHETQLVLLLHTPHTQVRIYMCTRLTIPLLNLSSHKVREHCASTRDPQLSYLSIIPIPVPISHRLSVSAPLLCMQAGTSHTVQSMHTAVPGDPYCSAAEFNCAWAPFCVYMCVLVSGSAAPWQRYAAVTLMLLYCSVYMTGCTSSVIWRWNLTCSLWRVIIYYCGCMMMLRVKNYVCKCLSTKSTHELMQDVALIHVAYH